MCSRIWIKLKRNKCSIFCNTVNIPLKKHSKPPHFFFISRTPLGNPALRRSRSVYITTFPIAPSRAVIRYVVKRSVNNTNTKMETTIVVWQFPSLSLFYPPIIWNDNDCSVTKPKYLVGYLKWRQWKTTVWTLTTTTTTTIVRAVAAVEFTRISAANCRTGGPCRW